MATSKNRTSSSNDATSEVTGATSSKRKGGRPPKKPEERYRPTHIYFHPKIVEWAKAEAERRGTKYQSVINEKLLEVIDS